VRCELIWLSRCGIRNWSDELVGRCVADFTVGVGVVGARGAECWMGYGV